MKERERREVMAIKIKISDTIIVDTIVVDINVVQWMGQSEKTFNLHLTWFKSYFLEKVMFELLEFLLIRLSEKFFHFKS